MVFQSSLTAIGRTRLKTLLRLRWQHKTEDVGWQHVQTPVAAMVFARAPRASVVLYGSAYYRSLRYKRLIPSPQASRLERDNKINQRLPLEYSSLTECTAGEIVLPCSSAFVVCSCRAVCSDRLHLCGNNLYRNACASDPLILRTL